MDEKKKPNGGYSRLKAKYAKLAEENKRLSAEIEDDNAVIKSLRIELSEKDGVIEQQSTTISELTCQVAESEGARLAERAAYEVKTEELFDHMGWFRRWIWELEH